MIDSNEYAWEGETAGAASQPLWRRLLLPDITRTRWRILEDGRRFLLVVVLIIGSLVVELDAFFLKDLLWVPPSSVLNVYRLIIWWLICMPGIRDYYAFTIDPTVRRIGAACWLMLAAMALEFALVIKWGALHHYANATPPPTVVWTWCVALVIIVGLAVMWFGFVLVRLEAQRVERNDVEVRISWLDIAKAFSGSSGPSTSGKGSRERGGGA